MSIMLPGELVEVMDILGFNWPQADEDKIFECAQAWKDYASDVERVIADADRACREAVEHNRGEAITAFEGHWQQLGGQGDLRRAADAATVVGEALDLFGHAVIAMKTATITQLGIAAAAVIASVASAIFTAGLSTLVGAGAMQAARIAIREIIQELIEKLVKTIIPKLRHQAGDIFEQMIKRLRRYLDELVTKLRRMVDRKGPDLPGPAARPASSIRQLQRPDRLTSRQTDRLQHCGDPVDVAAGRVLLTQTDAELAGMLPLVVRRTHLSSYRVGRWFGPSWASTVDQRLEIDDTGVYYAAEDGMLLAYPTPAEGIAVLPEQGPRWPLRRGDDGGYTITDPQRGRTLHFAAIGASRPVVLPLRAITGRAGHRIELGYDQSGTLTELRHSGGYRIGVETTGARITALRLRQASNGSDADVVLVRYGYDGIGRLTEVINSSGVPMRFDYDTAGRLVSWQDRNDVSYRYTYDEAGRCVRTSGPGGYMNATFTYDPANQVTVYTNSLGHPTTFHLNTRGQVTREIDPLGQETTSVWDRYDRLLARTDPLGRTTRYTYDGAGNLVAITRPDGSQAFAAYNELQLPVRITDPAGATWRHAYDEHGNLTAVIDPLGATTSYACDERGHPGEVVDALGHVRHIKTDAAGLLTAVTDPLGATTHCTRDAFGRVVAVTDPVGGVTRFGWTVEGKPAWRTLPDGATEHWSYDGEGNLTEHVDALGQVTRTEIGPLDLPAAQIGPDGTRLEFAYDTELRLVAVTNPQGLVWRYEYDPAGNLVRETDFNGRVLAYTHDATGQLTTRTNSAGQTITFVRDLLGNIIEQRSGDAVSTFCYDSIGRLAAATNTDAELVIERDPLGRIVAETCNGRTLTCAYDTLGRRVSRRTPTGAESTWNYDPNHLPIALHTAGQSLYFGYDPAGREIERHLGAHAVLAQTWDTNHRLASQTLTADGLGLGRPASAQEARLVQRRAYAYRPDGYVTSIDDHLTGARRFDLDHNGQVTAVHGPAWTECYSYDSAGNITHATWPTPSQADPLDGDVRGEREYAGTLIRQAGDTRYQHDSLGRVTLRQQKRLSAKPRTWHYTWDTNDRLVAVITPDKQHWQYTYDPLGRRLAKKRLGDDNATVVEQIDFTWDGAVLAEQTHIAPDLPAARTTVWNWEPGTFRPVSQTERAPIKDTPLTPRDTPGNNLRDAPQEWVDAQFYAIVTDLIGTPTEMVGPGGDIAWRDRTTLWGSTVISAPGEVDCPLRFPGQYHDTETSLHYNYHRYYDPAVARYGCNDPLGLSAGVLPHSYVHNPVSWIDPLGLAASGGIEWVDPNLINFSQRTISANNYAELMRSGQWDWERSGTALRVMDVDGQLVTYDNRRLDAAREVGGSVTVQRVNPNDAHPDSTTGKTWGDKFSERMNDVRNRREGGPVPRSGISERPKVKCKGQ